jgi:hypothetical protein
MNATPKKRKFYFNFIDVILIVVALAAIAALVFFVKERRIVVDNEGKNSVEILYKIEVSPMREEFRNLTEVGNAVIDTVHMTELGEVTEVSYSACHYVGTDPNTGLPVSTPYPGKVTMTLTVKATAIETATGYEIGGHALILGESLSFRVPDFAGSGTCIAIAKSSSGQS